MANTTRSSIKARAKKSSIRSAKTGKSKIAKPRVKAHHAGTTGTYWKGNSKGQTLKVSYNGNGNKFAFTLGNTKGKIGSTFHVSGNQLMNIMGIPLMVVPT
jgi:hypothetical protein